MIDDAKEYTSADVLTLDDALSLAVLGYRVRAVDMQPGCYVDYNFNGWRINFESGSSSGWSQRQHDYGVDWHVIDEPPPALTIKPTQSLALNQQKWGRVPRAEPPVGDVLVIDHAGQWGVNPAEALRAVAVDVAAANGLGVDHASFDAAAKAMDEPIPAPNVGKWGKAAPSSDASKWGSWGKPK